MSAVRLTTTFTPAPTCTANVYTEGIYYSIGGPSPSVCFPSGWKSISQHFSPGLCPTGYTQACANMVTAGTVTETQATCCPTGYACYKPTIFNFPGQACVSLILSETTTTVTNATNNKPMLATLHPNTEAVNGYGVLIRYQSTDFVSTTSSSASPIRKSGSPIASSTHPISSSSSSASDKAATSSRLSTGAKAGIGVGAVVLCLAILIGLAMLFLARRRKARSTRQEVDGTGLGYPQRYEVPGEVPMIQKRKEHEVYIPPAELGGGDVMR